MVGSLVVACLAFGGIFMLAGAGWALLAGACLVFALWRREPDWRALGSRAAGMYGRLAGLVAARPKRVTSVTGMAAAGGVFSVGVGRAGGGGAGAVAGGAGGP